METALTVICVCLTVLFSGLLYKYVSLKRNIRHFSRELERLKSSDYRQPVKVGDFDKDIVELAVKVNEHTDIQRRLGIEYEESKKQLSTVISGISHDFRTPLTASLGYMQMIEKSGELSERNAGYLETAMQKNRYLKELSDEFFELTKLESGGEETALEKVNLSNALTEILLEQHEWIEERGIKAEFDISDGVMITSDPHLLSRILNNLMSNAKKYAADRFGASLSAETDHAVLRVYNTVPDGVDIDIGRVFEPFYRYEARTESGSGLGLYVVKLLCERMGYTVSADIGNGDLFTVEISIPPSEDTTEK